MNATTNNVGPCSPKDLVAHEWIAAIGGSERVFEQFLHALPGCRAICLWNDDPDGFPGVEETWLGRSPLRGHKLLSMPFMDDAWNRIDLAGIDRILVSSHAFAHHLAARAASIGIRSFAYIHTPARYIWSPELDNRGNALVGLGRPAFRRWDRHQVSPHVSYAANSNFVAQRISDAWDVEARVLYPPADVQHIKACTCAISSEEEGVVSRLPSQFILGASRFVRYKTLEGAIRAGEIADMPVVLVGSGPDESRLRALAAQARVPVLFTGAVSHALLMMLYRQAALFVYMAIEDFGIMPVEAMASGTRTLVNTIGGAGESVLSVRGGIAAAWQNSGFEDSSAVEAALTLDINGAMSRLSHFSVETFRERLDVWLGSAVA